MYEVVGRVARVKRERDHDIHIVLADPEDPRERLVVESDDPNFRGNAVSPYRERLAAARQMFDDLVKQSGARELNDLRGSTVRVTGVGFFDMNHFQIGRSRSCIELHPILAIERVREHSSRRLTDPHFNSSMDGINRLGNAWWAHRRGPGSSFHGGAVCWVDRFIAPIEASG